MEDNFAEFMKVLAVEVKAYKPLAAETLRIFDETTKAAAEKKPSGGATGAARQALQKLRSALLSTTHYMKAKAVAAVMVKETGKDFSKAFELAVRAYAAHQLARLDYSLHEGADASHYKSREQSPLHDRPDVVRLVEAIEPYGVSPYMLGGLYAWMTPFVARLFLDANQDRTFERPDNVWPLLKRAGFLDAYDGELSDDETRLLAGAAVVRDDPEALARWEQFDQRFGDLEITAGFKATIQRLINMSSELSEGEARAMFDARGQRRLAQTETMGKLLGLTADELTKIDAFVRIIDDPTWTTVGGEDDVNRRLIVNSLLLHFEECEQKGEHPSEWLSSLVPKLLREDGFIARNVSSEAAFWSLTFVALELSTFRQREEIKFLRQRATADQAARNALKDFYQRHDLTHHTDDDGVPWLGETLSEENQTEHSQGQQSASQSPPASNRPSTGTIGAADHIVEADFSAVDEDHSTEGAEHRATIAPDERNRANRSSATTNHPFEEFE